MLRSGEAVLSLVSGPVSGCLLPHSVNRVETTGLFSLQKNSPRVKRKAETLALVQAKGTVTQLFQISVFTFPQQHLLRDIVKKNNNTKYIALISYCISTVIQMIFFFISKCETG